MKQPKLSDLELDSEATRQTRSRAANAKKVKITINIEEDVLRAVRKEAELSGVPYQNLVNRLLQSALDEKRKESLRLDRLEKEVRSLKKKLSA